MNRTEILHYLRTNSKVDDKRLIDLIDDCCNEVNKSVRLLRTYTSNDITRTMVLQACLASKIEEVCDGIEDELKAHGMTLRMRYSPGYFDLDIKENKKFFELMDITKRIGLTLTDTYQMVPSKSVTAFIGIEND